MNPSSAPLWRVALLIISLALGASGCGPRDPLDRVVSAESPTAFSMWRSSAAGYLNASQLQDFDEATRELKMAVMNNRETTGTAAVEEAMREKINGKTVREAMRLAYESKIKRLEVDLKGLAIATEQNSRLTTRPGDTDSSKYLAGFNERQKTRVDATERDLHAAQEKLKALGPPADAAKR